MSLHSSQRGESKRYPIDSFSLALSLVSNIQVQRYQLLISLNCSGTAYIDYCFQNDTKTLSCFLSFQNYTIFGF